MKIFITLFALVFISTIHAQTKYQGLLWEITGNGLTQPSYLYGTMHVSDKVAFHLGDSFYLALQSVDVVALESNPKNWQDDFSRSNFYRSENQYQSTSNAPLYADDFRIHNFQNSLKIALNKDPQMINGMLYRAYSRSVDFEENTFLDMYIFQTGKKYGKVLTGVEDFDGTEKLVQEAYEDMAMDKHKRKFNNELDKDLGTASNDAYRRGDLDMMDSITKMEFLSDAFLEKFLYIRNNNMVRSMDSIMKRSRLFVGVGCAHLPGNRGVIRQLREKGYNVRAVSMGERNSLEKAKVDSTIIHLNFSKQYTSDSLIEMDLPGKLYYFPDYDGFDQHQFADMINGAYYLVTRVKSNAALFGKNEAYILSQLDSTLYENISGKVIQKNPIKKDGYIGYDIITRTTRGDLNRYQILITPLEIVIFKMGGNGNFIYQEEANKFFKSIKFNNPTLPLKPSPAVYDSQHSYNVLFPSKPIQLSVINDDTRFDENFISMGNDGNTYLTMRKSFYNYRFLEEDTTELNLMNEGFTSSFKNIKKESKRIYGSYANFPMLEIWYKNNDKSQLRVRYIKQGINYYILAARFKKENQEVSDYFQSFKLYSNSTNNYFNYTDTSLFFEVKTNIQPLKVTKSYNSYYGNTGNNSNESFYSDNKKRIFENSATGEKIEVHYLRYAKYDSRSDTDFFLYQLEYDSNNDFFVQKNKKITKTTDELRLDLEFADTNSSIVIHQFHILRGRVLFTITSQYDSIQGEGNFSRTFYESFKPLDTIIGIPLFQSMTDTLFYNYFSTDSMMNAQAKAGINDIGYHKADILKLFNAILHVRKDDDYTETKVKFIKELSYIDSSDIIVDFIENEYLKSTDTASIQFAYLTVLANQRTEKSYTLLRTLICKDPPLSNSDNQVSQLFYRLNDSLRLTAGLFPDFLKLTALDEYKYKVYGLLAMLVDSGYIKTNLYESAHKQLIIEAKVEQKKNINKPESGTVSYVDYNNNGFYENTRTEEFCILLIPLANSDIKVKSYLDKLMLLPTSELKLNLVLIYLRNGIPIPEGLIDTFAQSDLYRLPLYNGLESINKLELYPSKLTQELIARSILLNSTSSNRKPDTLVLLMTEDLKFKGVIGKVYYYKYKTNITDAYWSIGISGLQPPEKDKFSRNNDLTTLTDTRIDDEVPLKKQLHEEMKLLIRSQKHHHNYRYSGDY